MTGAHVFHVPQPYRANKDQTVEKPRSRFRWFGHAIGRSNKHLTAVESPRASRRTRSSYLPNDDEFSPSNTPRAKSLTSEADLHKFGLLKHPKSPVDNHSFRSSIASTVSTSTTQSDDLSPRMDNDTTTENDVWIDHAHVVRHYESLNWRLVRIQADGNCLFRAVSDQIYRNEAFYGDIRRRVVEYIEREKELFQPFVENENSGRFEPIDDYCIRMKKDAEWGGNPELYAVARLFNVRIYVHQGPKRRLSIENGCTEAPDMDMHLLFRNDHYDSLHDEAHLDEKPRLSTTLNMDLDEKAPLSVMTENQKEEPKTEEKKKKKKKSVVFIGEQTRVERVEVELAECVMHKPVRLVVHQGKVCTPEESNQGVDNQEIESEQTHSVPDSEECPATEPQPSPEDKPSTDNQKSDLHVVRAKRVSFRKGRRVAA